MSVDKSMPILIVDDQTTILRINRYMLNQLGFSNIDDASDGEQAMEKALKKEFKLILRLEYGASRRSNFFKEY